MKRFLLAVSIALMALTAAAQSVNMMSMARAELVKRGLEEEEVRARLLENGIDVDNIPPAEYPAYQSRVIAILNQMQAEKAAASPAARAGSDMIEAVADEAVTPDEFPQTTLGEAAAEAALEEALAENHVSATEGDNIYGHALFTGTSMDVFRTTDGAQAPDTYILGEGDEIHISIFGSSQTEIHQRIGPDGSIQPAGSTKIFLKGMTLSQGRAAIQNKLAAHYSFRTDQIAVTITTARTVTVGIYGEVGVQGGFTLSALNTVFNALAAAGGPTRLGSVRNILLSRSGKNTRLDLYAYMTNPDPKIRYDIQNGDVIFVPVAQRIVSIEGAVNRAMAYELIDGETLIDLIGYAGGLRPDVYPDFIQIERFDAGEKKYLEYSLSPVLAGSQKVQVQNGDVVHVRSSNKDLDDYVITIDGDVYYGGTYELAKNTSLKTLIEKAQLRITAKTDYLFVERMRPDRTIEVITVPFPGVDGNPDFILQARDAVHILDQSSYRDVESISIAGQVRRPFTRSFGLNDRMTVNQAIDLAGGLRPSVFPVAYIFRRDLTNAQKMEYIRVNLDTDGETLLQPGDRLNIYDNTTFTDIGEVRVSGAVKEPFGTAYDPSLTVHDLLTMAGGFEVGAAFDRVEVFRLNISESEEVKFDQITLTVDDNYYPFQSDFQLQPFDHIVVRMTPNFTMGRTVEVNGRVKYPGVYVLEDNRTQLWQVIEMAGGLLDDADPYARLFRTYNNRGPIGLNLKKARQHKGRLNSDPILMTGDVINIVRQENTVTIRETGTRMAQYVPEDFASTQKTLIYQGEHRAGWYVRHYAGGFQKTADRRSVTMTLPNNQSVGTRSFMGIKFYPRVQPGSVITLRIDQEKREKIERPKEKVDWEGTISRSLSVLTSVISIVLLSERLYENAKN